MALLSLMVSCSGSAPLCRLRLLQLWSAKITSKSFFITSCTGLSGRQGLASWTVLWGSSVTKAQCGSVLALARTTPSRTYAARELNYNQGYKGGRLERTSVRDGHVLAAGAATGNTWWGSCTDSIIRSIRAIDLNDIGDPR